MGHPYLPAPKSYRQKRQETPSLNPHPLCAQTKVDELHPQDSEEREGLDAEDGSGCASRSTIRTMAGGALPRLDHFSRLHLHHCCDPLQVSLQTRSHIQSSKGLSDWPLGDKSTSGGLGRGCSSLYPAGGTGEAPQEAEHVADTTEPRSQAESRGLGPH